METELAWAAGFFDGEGWTTRSKPRALIVGVGQKDLRPITRFHDVIGVGNISHLASGMHQWQACGDKAREAMQLLDPYLSDPKREQYLRVEAAIAAEPPRKSRAKTCLPGCTCGRHKSKKKALAPW